MNTGIRGRRRTAAVIATAGALAFSVLNAPAAQAADTGIVVSDLVINDYKPIVVGTSKVVEPPVSLFMTLPAGYSTDDSSSWDVSPFLYRGGLTNHGYNYIGLDSLTCYEHSSQSARCEGNLRIDPGPTRYDADSNSDATKWKIGVHLMLFKANGHLQAEEYESRPGTLSLRRATKLTVADATPEPVAQGKKVTVVGKLTRANWTTKKNDPYGGSRVSLQFRARNASAFRTVKKVTTNSAGVLRTTVTASTDGFYRWVYSGNTVTGTATSGQDFVDVR
ncbi:hypothetical protein [Streptomyces graminilatus]|uniref:hypothetical protein n=1 Tax=Streptomyces graminilatus TaxID=1464070 RepID=UPI0006E26769|nr:hypothetical protein [Streptomyces graminilatus]